MDKIFIEQAKQIRTEYIKIYKELEKCQSEIDRYKEQLVHIKSELDNNDNMTENGLKETLLIIEKNIRTVENIFKPHMDKMKILEKNADILFENIKDRYPNITEKEIQNELIPYLAEIKF